MPAAARRSWFALDVKYKATKAAVELRGGGESRPQGPQLPGKHLAERSRGWEGLTYGEMKEDMKPWLADHETAGQKQVQGDGFH